MSWPEVIYTVGYVKAESTKIKPLGSAYILCLICANFVKCMKTKVVCIIKDMRYYNFEIAANVVYSI